MESGLRTTQNGGMYDYHGQCRESVYGVGPRHGGGGGGGERGEDAEKAPGPWVVNLAFDVLVVDR